MGSTFKVSMAFVMLCVGSGCAVGSEEPKDERSDVRVEAHEETAPQMMAITCSYTCAGKGITSDGASGTCTGGSTGAGSCYDANQNCASGFTLSNCGAQ